MEEYKLSSRLIEIFEDEKLIERIKRRLPYLFQIAEIESSRAGRVGMEVGSLREKALVALLIHKFGEDNVETEIPITKPEIDVKLFGKPISIKTITSKGFSGVKISWTVDAQRSKEFRENYFPHFDILFVRIDWDAMGGFYYIPSEVQGKLFKEMGKENYIKLPKPGTNPRGIEITKEALSCLVENEETKIIEIFWQKSEIDYSPYERWVDYWDED